jgi:hypothetical protein
MVFKKHEPAPPPDKGVHETDDLHNYMQRWDPTRLASVYVRLLTESLRQEPKYFDD